MARGKSSSNGDDGTNMFVIGIIVVLLLFILGFVIYQYSSGEKDHHSETTIFKWFGEKNTDKDHSK